MMTVTQNHRIIPDGGLTQKEFDHFNDEFAKLEERLDSLSRGFHGDISVKDKEKSSQKTTLEIWVQGMPRIVATSNEESLHDAFRDVVQKALTQISHEKDKQKRNS